MIGLVNDYFYTSAPAGIIVPYAATGAAPTGWTLFTAPNTGQPGFPGSYIVGAGNTYAVAEEGIGGAPDGYVVFSSASDGAHAIPLNGTSRENVMTGPNAHSNIAESYYRGAFGTSAEGAHTHTITGKPTIGYNQVQFIRASTQRDFFPAKSLLLTTNGTTIPGLSEFTSVSPLTSARLLRAGSSIQQGSTGISPTMVAGEGKHKHNWTYYDAPDDSSKTVKSRPPYYNSKNPNLSGQAGGHEHDINDTVLNIDDIKKVYLAAWTKTSGFLGFQGMIGFWQNATPPVGWAMCDGNNGTLDLRDFFIMMVSRTHAKRGTKEGSGNTVTVSHLDHENMLASNHFGYFGIAGNPIHHYHWQKDDEAWPSIEWVSAAGVKKNVLQVSQHTDIAFDHYHPGTESGPVSFLPQYYALYIIQKI